LNYTSFCTERTLAYFLDIINFRSDPVIFKTTAFLGRNFHRVSHTLGHIWIELKHVAHGFGALKRDTGFLLGFGAKRAMTKYSKDRYFERQKVR